MSLNSRFPLTVSSLALGVKLPIILNLPYILAAIDDEFINEMIECHSYTQLI